MNRGIAALAAVVQHEKLSEIGECLVMATTTDESREKANTSQQMNYYHGLKRNTGERVTVFAGVQPVPNGTRVSLREGLVQHWREDRVAPSKNVALGKDGMVEWQRSRFLP